MKKYCAIALVLLMTGCGVTKHLVYKDDWQGKYVLQEFNSCCTPVKDVWLILDKLEAEKYNWKMFFKNNADTIVGIAKLKNLKLEFFVSNIDVAKNYFSSGFSNKWCVFWIENDNYSNDGEKKYIDIFTRWNNELRDYKSSQKMFAGVDFHFKKEGTTR